MKHITLLPNGSFFDGRTYYANNKKGSIMNVKTTPTTDGMDIPENLKRQPEKKASPKETVKETPTSKV